MRHTRHLVSPLWLVSGALLWASVAEAVETVQAGSGANQIPVMDPYKDLTPAQVTAAKAAFDKIQTKMDIIFPTGDPNGDLWKQVNAQRVRENTEYFERLNSWSGDQSTVVAGNPVDGGFLLTGQTISSPRHFRESRILDGGPTVAIIEANGNILADQDRRLNNIANKLSKSKFACGQFDWALQLRANFNKAALTKFVDNLGESALAAAPMALLANISPTLYEIVKFMRGVASMDLNKSELKCQQLEAAFTDVGRRTIRGDGYAECIKANTGVGVSEAHRICTQEDSPFDGVESAAGGIKGFVGDSEPVSMTQMLGNKMQSQDKTVLAADAEARKRLDADVAKAAAGRRPNPGPADPTWTDGDPAKVAWTKAETEYKDGERAYAEAVDAHTQGYKTESDPGVWGRLQNSLADNLGSIIGNIDIGMKANIKVGQQDQYRLSLLYRFQAFKLAEDFGKQLEAHYQVIRQSPRNTDDVKASYAYLLGYSFATAQAPWLTIDDFAISENHHSHQVRFGFSTLDKLAVLWTKSRQGTDTSVARTIWETEFRTTEAVNLITEFEVYDYLLMHAKRDKSKLIAEATNLIAKADGSAVIMAGINKNMDDYMEFLAAHRRELIPQLCIVIDAVNSFQLNRPTNGYEPGQRAMPLIPATDQLGR